MSSFTRPLVVSPLPDGRSWVIREEFFYEIGHKGSGNKIIVPKGFLTDFASIPRLFWTLYPKWGKYGNAAVIHDYFYWEQFLSRKKSDKIFLEAMKVLNVSKFDYKIIYNSVRLFGEKAWEKNRKDKIKGKKKIVNLF